MENQPIATFNASNTLKQLKLMNKLGVSFFTLFLISMSLSLVDLGEWSNETISLYNIFEPTFLMILAVIGAIVYALGINRALSRVISFIFIALIVSTCLSQLYDIYDVAKSAREARGLDFEFKHFVRAMDEIIKSSPVHVFNNKTVPLNIIIVVTLLPISLIGIMGGILSPRFKENKALNAAITGQQFESTQLGSATNIESDKTNKSGFTLKVKTLLNNLLVKIINAIKTIYHIVKPLVNSLLDKGTEIICKQQPQLKPEKVKMVLGGLLALGIFLVVF